MKDKPKPRRKPGDRPRPDSELKDSAVDVDYEIRMMILSAHDVGCGMRGSPAITLEDWRVDMAMECCLLHYRNLRAFLWPSLQGKDWVPYVDDILATDFLKKPWQEEVGDKRKIGDDKERLDQMLCHLSYNRNNLFKDTDRKNRPWSTAKMVVAMLRELDTFLAKLPVHMKPWFPYRDTTEQYRAVLEQWAKNMPARQELIEK